MTDNLRARSGEKGKHVTTGLRRAGTLLMVLGMLATTIVLAPSAQAAPSRYPVDLELVANFAQPLDIQAPPGDPRLFIAERAGRIMIVKNGAKLGTPFLDIRNKVGTTFEGGLFGIAFHPDYSDNGLFYVHYTDEGSVSRLVEYEVSGNDDIADAGSARQLLSLAQPANNHNGGQIAFGPDGYLYVAFGDGGGSNTSRAQNNNNFFGTILRIDVDSGSPYGIPSDNPFVGKSGKDEIWAYGLRNPWRFYIDPVDELIYIGDVGQNRLEEINIEALSKAGLNYGWDITEGKSCYPPGTSCSKAGLTLPEQQHSHPGMQSITGGVVYRGHDIPEIRGLYFYADFVTNKIRSIRFENDTPTEQRVWSTELGSFANPVAFGLDSAGEMYIASLNGGVYKFVRERPAHCDFNGDGYDDIVFGAPGEDVGAIEDAGGINVVYGTKSGASSSGNQAWNQSSANIQGGAEAGDRFGASLACGDFDRDGFSDVAIGVPGESIGEVEGAGGVNVIYGSSSGLKSAGDEFWSQDSAGIIGTAEAGDGFGTSVAAGDIDRDGFDDLIVGVPGESIGSIEDAGGIAVLFGSGGGLSASGDEFWSQETAGIAGQPEANDRMGAAVASCDINFDGYADALVGAPGEAVGALANAGAIHSILGSSGGLKTAGDEWITQDTPGIPGTAEAGDRFGAAVDCGDMNLDGFGDALIGVPGESVFGNDAAGAFNVIYGASSGLNENNSEVWHQDTASVRGTAEPGDMVGAAVHVDDVDGDGISDAIVGAPGEAIGPRQGAGGGHVLFGRLSGLTASGDEFLDQDQPGIAGTAEAGDAFGSSVSIGDADGDRYGDVLLGVPGESIGSIAGAGGASLIYGTKSGTTSAGDQFWSQASSGIVGAAEAGDMGGFAVR